MTAIPSMRKVSRRRLNIKRGEKRGRNFSDRLRHVVDTIGRVTSELAE
jgi:hypothetical protein